MAGGSSQAGIKPIHPFRRAKRHNTGRAPQEVPGGRSKGSSPEHSYHCYGRAFDWVNILDPDGGDKGLGWDDNKAYAKGETIANQFDIRGIGADDDDHLQDSHFPTFADLPMTEFGSFPTAAVA